MAATECHIEYENIITV